MKIMYCIEQVFTSLSAIIGATEKHRYRCICEQVWGMGIRVKLVCSICLPLCISKARIPTLCVRYNLHTIKTFMFTFLFDSIYIISSTLETDALPCLCIGIGIGQGVT